MLIFKLLIEITLSMIYTVDSRWIPEWKVIRCYCNGRCCNMATNSLNEEQFLLRVNNDLFQAKNYYTIHSKSKT